MGVCRSESRLRRITKSKETRWCAVETIIWRYAPDTGSFESVVELVSPKIYPYSATRIDMLYEFDGDLYYHTSGGRMAEPHRYEPDTRPTYEADRTMILSAAA